VQRAAVFAGDVRSRGLAGPPPSIPARARGGAPVAPNRPGPTAAPVSAVAAEVGPPRPAPGFHGAVTEFKRRLIETTLTELGGNRTRAARALGLQRTYLLRLIREFAVQVPAGAVPARRGGGSPASPAPPG
jgi:DNA-binding NtrC family response regulator